MSNIMDNAPFIYRRKDDNGGYKLDVKGILQALIVAGIVGIAVMYSDQSKVIARLDAISSDIDEIRINQDKFRSDFYIPIHGPL